MEEPFQGKMAGRRIARKEPRVHCGGPQLHNAQEVFEGGGEIGASTVRQDVLSI